MPFDDDVDVCMMEHTLTRFVQLVNGDASSPLLVWKREPTGNLPHKRACRHVVLAVLCSVQEQGHDSHRSLLLTCRNL